jgi:hypothetical protein
LQPSCYPKGRKISGKCFRFWINIFLPPKPPSDNFKAAVITLRLTGLIIFILLIAIPLLQFGYASGGGFLANVAWQEHKYSNLEMILYQLLPGITFTLYFVLFFLGKTSIKIKILSVIFLIFVYLLIYVGACFTFGLVDVVTGGLGALFIKVGKKVRLSKKAYSNRWHRFRHRYILILPPKTCVNHFYQRYQRF